MIGKTKIMTVKFDLVLNNYAEIKKFRGAVIEVVGKENHLFHNHVGESGFRRAYPLIQYKTNKNQAMLIALNEGIEQLEVFFDKNPGQLMLGDVVKDISITEVKAFQHLFNIWDESFHYSIINWLPFNKKNFESYVSLKSDWDKIEMLEGILVGHILALASGINYHVDRKIKVRINSIEKEKRLQYKDAMMSAFNISFSTNASLPELIGMGKGSALGFGIVYPAK